MDGIQGKRREVKHEARQNTQEAEENVYQNVVRICKRFDIQRLRAGRQGNSVGVETERQ